MVIETVSIPRLVAREFPFYTKRYILSHQDGIAIDQGHENSTAHQYVIAIDDVTHELMACTCPHHVHRNACCKHMAAVENATDDGTLDAFPSEDDAEPEDCDCAGLGDSPAGRACERDGRNCRTNNGF